MVKIKSKRDIKHIFSLIANLYDIWTDIFTKNTIEKMLNLLPKGNLIVLEVGTASGYLAKKLSETHPNIKYIGLDLTEKILKIAKDNVKNPNFSFVVGDAEHPPIKPELADIVLNFNMLDIIPEENHHSIIKNFEETTKPKGALIISASRNLEKVLGENGYKIVGISKGEQYLFFKSNIYYAEKIQ